MELTTNQIYIQNEISILINLIKNIAIVLFTYYTNFKIINKRLEINIKNVFGIIFIVFMCILLETMQDSINGFVKILSITLIISMFFSIKNIGKSILTTMISLSINYIVFAFSIIISFIFNKILNINNDVINLIIIITYHLLLLCSVFRLKKFKYGLAFWQKDENGQYIDILVLNISVIILFTGIILSERDMSLFKNITTGLLLFSIIMLIVIQKAFQLYYKQKLLQKDLDETKEKLAKKEKEVEDLEAENIAISKKSHTLVHKQKSLEYKLEQMASNVEISKEEAAEVRERLKEIKKDLYKEKTTVKLDKTDIPQIDNMLEYMQSECEKNKIDFELQIKGNIHYMTNNLISKEDLETLLADHIKNAIIAINHTNNVNRSILVRLGEIDGIYSLYIYDSGVEFEKETLENLGKKPSTTHKDEGGTGMGFMNTFDTLRKCNASLTIEEIGAPSKDNYTKAIIIKFEKNNEFKVISYR